MASKGLSSSMYQFTMHFIESTYFVLPTKPLLAIPVVISSALPCPFCGGKDLQFISDVDGDRDVEFIVCMNNDCLCDGRIGKNKEEAFSRWNSRHCL